LDTIQREFLKYAPAYAQKEAAEAIAKVRELQSQGVIRDGVYYLVLVDLVGSTKFSVEHGNDAIKKRIELFIKASFDALNNSRKSNVGLFIKEIGDAVLYLFQHFPDVLRWKAKLDEWLSVYGKLTDEPFVVRTCVHIGEVSMDGVNPLSLGVSQTFKMEKSVQGGDLVLTDSAYHIAWPSIARAYHGFHAYGTCTLDGFPEQVALHQLVIHDSQDTQRITDEEFD
jgi:class 3 adenylate cyclase